MYTGLAEWIGRVPLARSLYLRKAWAPRMGAFFGTFASFAEAERFAASIHTRVGWNDPVLASFLVDGSEDEGNRKSDGPGFEGLPQPFLTSQFAVLLWLSKLLRPQSVVLDLGGAGGVFFEICTRYGLLDQPVQWHVVDLPEMIARGAARHAALKSEGISFGSDPGAVPPSDILLALGSVQYMPDPLGENGPGILDGLKALPGHVLINKVPLCDLPDAWTVQNHLSSACPYRLFNRDRFLEYFRARGYRPVDHWHVPELYMEIPFHPRRRIEKFDGIYFRRDP